MVRKVMLLLVVAIGVFMFSMGASAVEYTMNGSNATTLTKGNFPLSYGIQQVTAEGGNYTEFNVYQDVNSDNWQVFYGDVEKNITLDSGSGVAVYDFGSLTVTGGYVAFSEVNTVDWSAIQACTAACAVSEDNTLSLSGVDNTTSTFTANSNLLINLTGTGDILAGTSLALNSEGTGGQQWRTTMARTGVATEQIYFGHINVSQNNFLGGSSDFQVMVPTSDAGTRTYYVYAGLN